MPLANIKKKSLTNEGRQQHHHGGQTVGSPNWEACRVARGLAPGLSLPFSRLPQPLQQVVEALEVWRDVAPGPPLYVTEECCHDLVPPRSRRRLFFVPSLSEWGRLWRTRGQSRETALKSPRVLPATESRRCNTL